MEDTTNLVCFPTRAKYANTSEFWIKLYSHLTESETQKPSRLSILPHFSVLHTSYKENFVKAGHPLSPRACTLPPSSLLCSLSLCFLSQWPCYLCHTFLSYVETGKTGLSLSQLFTLPLSLSQTGGHQAALIQWKIWHNGSKKRNANRLMGDWSEWSCIICVCLLFSRTIWMQTRTETLSSIKTMIKRWNWALKSFNFHKKLALNEWFSVLKSSWEPFRFLFVLWPWHSLYLRASGTFLLLEKPETACVMSSRICSACVNDNQEVASLVKPEPGLTDDSKWHTESDWGSCSCVDYHYYSLLQSHSWRSECPVSSALHFGRPTGGGMGSVSLC